jgi:hypothetical protein
VTTVVVALVVLGMALEIRPGYSEAIKAHRPAGQAAQVLRDGRELDIR